MSDSASSEGERIALERGLPTALAEEKLILGSILLNDANYETIGPVLKPEHFALETHQTIYRAIAELKGKGERADRITLGQFLFSQRKLETVGGLTYLTSLDEGMPALPNLSGYVRIIRAKADLRALIATSQVLMNSALIGTESPDQIAQIAASTINRITAGMVTAKTSYTFADTVDAAGGLQEFLTPSKEGMPTGFPNLDRITYGLEPGLLYIIGGDSGHGKSSLAGNIASNVVFGNTGTEWPNDPVPAGIFSLEMSRQALYTRMLCSRAKVSSFRLKKGFMQAEERRAMNFAASELAVAPLYIDDSSGLSIKQFCDRVRAMKREHGVKAVFLDYLQLLNWREDGLKSEYEGVTFATYSLHELAKEEKIAVVALTQFNQEYSRRKDKSQRPTLDACHGSSSVKKDADIVVLLYRRSQAHPGVADEKNRIEFIVAKHRDGRTGMVIADWHGAWTTFVEAPDDQQTQPEDGA